jgi:cyclopropane fatty-acyl-phospholipid synthase-like methyltransferase
MHDIYRDGTYQSNNPTWHVEDSPWKAQQIEKILAKNNIVPRTVAEVGCGAGEILIRLQKTFPNADFSGYEVSPQAFSLCRTRENARAHFYLKNLLEERNSFFDVLLCIDVFEHIDDHIGFLRRLKDRGDLKVFHIPLDLSAQTLIRARPILQARKLYGHLHYFFKDTALATLKYCGYNVIDYVYTGTQLDLHNAPFRAKLLKTPRKIMFKINADLAVRVLGGYSLLVLAR